MRNKWNHKAPEGTQAVVVYETVVFVDSDGYLEAEAAADEATKTAGGDPWWPGLYRGCEEWWDGLTDHLMQWENGDGGEERDEPPWGSGDETHEVDGYVVSWNSGMYASLTRVSERDR